MTCVAALIGSIVTVGLRGVVVAGRPIRCMPVILVAGALLMVLKRHALPDRDGGNALHRHGEGQKRYGEDSKCPEHRGIVRQLL